MVNFTRVSKFCAVALALLAPICCETSVAQVAPAVDEPTMVPASNDLQGSASGSSGVLRTEESPYKAAPCPGSTHDLEEIFLDPVVEAGLGVPTVNLARTHMGFEWERDFVAVVLDMMNGDLYWYDDLEPPANRLVKIPKGREFMPAGYTKEKMLLIVCNAHFNTSAGATPTAITVPEATAEIAAAASAPAATASAPPASAVQQAPGGPTQPSAPPAATATPPSPKTGGVKPNFQPVAPSIPEARPPTDAETQQVVSAVRAYEKTYGVLRQIKEDANALDLDKRVRNVEGDADAALKENQEASDPAVVPDGRGGWTPGPAQGAGNGSFKYDDAVNEAIDLTGESLPKIASLRTKYQNAHFDKMTPTLKTQYDAIWSAVNEYVDSSPDIVLLRKLITASPQPFSKEEVDGWREEYTERIKEHQKLMEDAADAAMKDDPDFTGLAELPTPKHVAEVAQALAKQIDSLLPALKAMAKSLNEDYVKSRVNIVIPVPSVTSNSLQLFSLTVTDNYRPLNWTDPPPAANSGSQDGSVNGGSCPKGCVAACPCSGTSPAPAASNSSTPQPAAGLQLSAIKPGAAPSISSSPVQVSKQVDGNGNVAITASFIVPFHRIVHFAASGGFLDALIPSNAFTTETLPDNVVTTTTTTTTSPGVPTATNPTPPPVTTITQTIVPTTGTATFGFQSQKQSYQTAGILGIIWYPLGRDSFVVSRKAVNFGIPAAYTYSRHTWAQQFVPGILLATAVNTAGTFVVAPEWDIAPGVSLFGGLTLADKTSIAENVTLCSSLGSSTNTMQYGPTTTTSGGTTVTTQVQVQTTTGCSNSDATMLSGTTVPTVTGISPGFGFGIVFNSSLFSYFGGKN